MAREDPSALLAALRHPERRAILRHLSKSGKPVSPSELSRLFEEPLSNLGYHVRVLVACDALILHHIEQVRGAIKHFYVINPAVDSTGWVRESLGL